MDAVLDRLEQDDVRVWLADGTTIRIPFGMLHRFLGLDQFGQPIFVEDPLDFRQRLSVRDVGLAAAGVVY